MDDYIFIYKDSLDRYNLARNPRFIAMHCNCAGVPKEFVNLLYDKPEDLIRDLNSDTLTDNAKDVIVKTDLYDIAYNKLNDEE